MTTRKSLPEEVRAILLAPSEARRSAIEVLLQVQPELGPALALAMEEHVSKMEQAIQECQNAQNKLREALEELTQPPLRLAAVLAADNGRCLVAIGSTRQEVVVHPDLRGQSFATGDVVAINPEENILVKRLADYHAPGRVGTVRGWHGDKLLVEAPPDQALALDASPAVRDAALKPGDQVLYEEQWRIAMEVVESLRRSEPEPVERVGWDQIGGLDDVIAELRLDFEARLLHPEPAAELGLLPLRGGLLVGPPGTGKTLLVKALATWLREVHGRKVHFRSVPPGSWRDPFYGMTERRIVEPLQEGRRRLADGEADLVLLFYDELDTLGSRSAEVTNRIDSRVLTAFLTELDGMAGRDGIVVLGATNRIDLVDESLLRPGRFGDLILAVPRPGREATRAIARCHLRPSVKFWTDGQAVPPDEMVEHCIDALVGHLFRDADPADALAELTLAGGQRRLVWPRDVLSGALIANVVQKAKRLALKRSLIGPAGLTVEDLLEAADDELDSLARRLEDPFKAREILGDRDLPVVRVEPRR